MFFLLQSNLWLQLEKLDQWLFIKINSGSANPFFDSLMPFMRYPLNWAPLYLFLGAFALLNYKGKGAWWILFFICTIALTDMTGNHLFKQNFERMRPCRDPDFFYNVRLLVNHCSTGYSFISNHAANHFGLAAFFFLTTKPLLKRWAWIAFAWAVLIAYAQVYVGIHYPFDVMAGALLGLLLGTLTGTIFNKRYGFAIFEPQSTVPS
jgi:membrane-associated phospholipid phosphatase